MALTVETLQSNTALAGLTTEQLQAISQMSANDEANVIGARIGALHGLYDSDILSITGVSKNAGEKSYDYMKRVLTDYKGTIDSNDSIIRTLQDEKAALEAKIASGSADAALKQKLQDTESRLSQLQAKYDADKAAFDKSKDDFLKREQDLRFGYAFDKAASTLAFRDGITDSIKSLLLRDAKAQILAKGTPEFIDEAGETRVIFRGKNGEILNNINNNLNPYTIFELLAEVPSIVEVLGKPGSGGGTNPPKPSPTTTVDISGARNQVEADDIIAKYLMEKEGLLRYTPEFVKRSTELRKELGVDKLNIR